MTQSMPANPFNYLRSVPPAAFLGRWPLVRTIAQDLLGASDNSHAIIAGRRLGKTSLLRALEHHLLDPSAPDYGHTAVVVRVTLEALRLTSEAHFFAIVLERLRTRLAHAKRVSTGAAPARPPLDDGLLDRCADRLTAERTLIPFEVAVAHIFERLSYVQGPTRLVLLLDEMDAILGAECHELLMGQLRATVSDSDIADGVRLVAAGSRRFLDDVNRPGSPFLNVLKIHYLQAFDEDVFASLAARCDALPDEARREVWRQSGGHPFLAQYLLHNLWLGGCERATPATVRQLVDDFLHELGTYLSGWAKDLGTSGLAAYDRFVDESGWIDEITLINDIGPGSGDVRGDLAALWYHGFILQGDHWRRYRRAGDLLRQWHVQEGRRLMLRWADAARLAEWEGNMPRIHISASGSIVNVNSRLARVTQTIAGMQTVDESVKEELTRLVADLRQAMQDVPADRTTEAEKLAKRVDALIEEVAKPDPDRVLVEAHTKDLTRVASVFQSILPAVVRIAGQIIALVTGIGS